MVTTPLRNHIPIGSLDCNGSGCHYHQERQRRRLQARHREHQHPDAHASPATPPWRQRSRPARAATRAATLPRHAGRARHDRRGLAPDGLRQGPPDQRRLQRLSHHDAHVCGQRDPGSGKPANHIPTTAACAQCHTTAGNYAVYSVTGIHQGVTGCLTCHATDGRRPFANITMVTGPANHIPIGSLDCNGSGCHRTENVNAGGFKLGTASINTPTLTVAGHSTVAAAVAACQTCHESATLPRHARRAPPRPPGTHVPRAFDASHPTTRRLQRLSYDHADLCGQRRPRAASRPTTSRPPPPAAQCHTTAGNYAVYSVTGTHQGVTGAASPAMRRRSRTTFAQHHDRDDARRNHIPIGTLDCNGSGCHTDHQRQRRRLQARHREHQRPDAQRRRPHHGRLGGRQPARPATRPPRTSGMLASTASAAADSRPTRVR